MIKKILKWMNDFFLAEGSGIVAFVGAICIIVTITTLISRPGPETTFYFCAIVFGYLCQTTRWYVMLRQSDFFRVRARLALPIMILGSFVSPAMAVIVLIVIISKTIWEIFRKFFEIFFITNELE